jgi:DNA (cytosine-5)-methyltransferase 3A
MGINVLSLFDGMSCGQQALERAGITVDNYFASEIDKYAMQVTMANYPNTKQLGSVVNVNGYDLPKIDLLIGGSPCQSFSFAGKRKGMATKCETEILTLNHYLELKADGYEFEGQSYLFWEFMRLLNECNPKYFLLENVEMGEKWEKVLSKAIGVNGIHINSSLVSAQNRKRIYWTNIGMQPGGLFGDLQSIIKQPKNKGILLKDVLENEVNDKYFLSEKIQNQFKSYLFGGNIVGTTKPEFRTIGQRDEVYGQDGKMGCLNATDYKQPKQIIVGLTEVRTNEAKQNLSTDYIVHNTMPRSSTTGKGGTGHLTRNDGKTYCLDTGNTNAVEIVGLTEVRTQEAKQIRKETGTNPKRAKELILRTDGKIGAILTSQTPDNLVISKTLRTHNDGKGFREVVSGKGATIPARAREDGSGQNIVSILGNIRRLTPLECERLQTVPDNYTNHVSDSQRYKMLGNGWTIDIISHIFKYL